MNTTIKTISITLFLFLTGFAVQAQDDYDDAPKAQKKIYNYHRWFPITNITYSGTSILLVCEPDFFMSALVKFKEAEKLNGVPYGTDGANIFK